MKDSALLKKAPTMFKPIFETESKPNLAFLRSMFFRCVIFISMISLISSTLNLVFGIGQILMKVHLLIGEELLHDKRLVAGTIAISVQVLLSQSLPWQSSNQSFPWQNKNWFVLQEFILRDSYSSNKKPSVVRKRREPTTHLGGIPLSVISNVFAHCLIHSFLIAAI